VNEQKIDKEEKNGNIFIFVKIEITELSFASFATIFSNPVTEFEKKLIFKND